MSVWWQSSGEARFADPVSSAPWHTSRIVLNAVFFLLFRLVCLSGMQLCWCACCLRDLIVVLACVKLIEAGCNVRPRRPVRAGDVRRPRFVLHPKERVQRPERLLRLPPGVREKRQQLEYAIYNLPSAFFVYRDRGREKARDRNRDSSDFDVCKKERRCMFCDTPCTFRCGCWHISVQFLLTTKKKQKRISTTVPRVSLCLVACLTFVRTVPRCCCCCCVPYIYPSQVLG